MDFFLNRYRNLTVLLIVIVAQLLLLAYQVKSNNDVALIRVWAVTAVTPVETGPGVGAPLHLGIRGRLLCPAGRAQPKRKAAA